MSNKTNCPLCSALKVRYRDKEIVTLDAIADQARVRFYIEGLDSVHTMVWGDLQYHCTGESRPALGFKGTLHTFLLEEFLEREHLPFNPVLDVKHPWVYGGAEDETPKAADESMNDFIETVGVQAQEMKLHLIFPTSQAEPPVAVVPLDRKYLPNGVPELRFGAEKSLELTPKAFEEFVAPKYPELSIKKLAETPARLIDVKMRFTLEGAGTFSDNRSWFDSRVFYRRTTSREPEVGKFVQLTLDKKYVARARDIGRF